MVWPRFVVQRVFPTLEFWFFRNEVSVTLSLPSRSFFPKGHAINSSACLYFSLVDYRPGGLPVKQSQAQEALECKSRLRGGSVHVGSWGELRQQTQSHLPVRWDPRQGHWTSVDQPEKSLPSCFSSKMIPCTFQEHEEFGANQDSNQMQTSKLERTSDRAANWQIPVACYVNRSSATAIARIMLLTDPPHTGYWKLDPCEVSGCLSLC